MRQTIDDQYELDECESMREATKEDIVKKSIVWEWIKGNIYAKKEVVVCDKDQNYKMMVYKMLILLLLQES